MAELKSSLATLQGSVNSVDAPTRLGRSPGRKRRGRPPKAGKGVRPRDIIAEIQKAAPGHHAQPSALVSTILARLERRGEAKRRAGKWYAA